MTTHPAFQPHLSYVLAEGYTSMQATPLLTRGGQTAGAIITCFVRRYTPPEEDLGLLDVYATLAAATIEREEQIAAQVRTEKALREAVAAKDEFLGLVSHELRTPMTVVRGLASILNRNRELTPDELGQTYCDLANESERLHRLIENMLVLARMQTGRGPPLEPISVNRFLEDYAETLRQELPGLALTLNELPRDRTGMCVQRHLEQTLHNLVENAYKYSPHGAPIQLGATEDETSVRISVADRGIGLRDTGALFEAFHREAEAERVAGGLGLGLAVCKTLVEAHGGRIWAESREGGGSTFTFTLPLAPDASD
jgi:two-component system sensor histidine kinase KdpD